MTQVDHHEPNNPYWYCKTAVPEYIANDQIWLWAMRTARIHDKHIQCGKVMSNANDITVQNILCLGLYDWTPEDCPWDNSTQSIRYATVLSNCLWELLHLEQQRVVPLSVINGQ